MTLIVKKRNDIEGEGNERNDIGRVKVRRGTATLYMYTLGVEILRTPLEYPLQNKNLHLLSWQWPLGRNLLVPTDNITMDVNTVTHSQHQIC